MINGSNSQSTTYIRFRLWIFAAVGLFLIGIGAGIAIALTTPDVITDFFTEELIALGELGEDYDTSPAAMAVFIFSKNVMAMLLSFILSPILCLVPIFSLLFNSSLISFLSVIVVQEESVGYLLGGLLPHGILEIPAFIIAQAAALSFGATTIMALFSRGSKTQLMPVFKKSLKYLLIAFILLVPAAIIEAFVTPLFLD